MWKYDFPKEIICIAVNNKIPAVCLQFPVLPAKAPKSLFGQFEVKKLINGEKLGLGKLWKFALIQFLKREKCILDQFWEADIWILVNI